MIDIGRLTSRVYIASADLVASGDTTVEQIRAGATAFWASVTPASSASRVNQGRTCGLITHQIATHYRTDISVGTFLMIGSRILRVESPPRNEQESDRITYIDCTELTDVKLRLE